MSGTATRAIQNNRSSRRCHGSSRRTLAFRASRVASQRLGGARGAANAGAPGDRFPEGWQARWGQRSRVGCWYGLAAAVSSASALFPTTTPARQPGARPPCGGWIDLASIPLRAITHAITEFEFHISPVSSSSRPHTGVGTRGTTSSTRRACCSSSVSRLGLSTASATSGISPLPRERSDRRRLPGARRTVPEQESAAARRDGSPRHQRFKRLKGALGVVGREVFPSRGWHHARHLLRNIRLPPPEPHRDAQFCPFVLGKRASDLCEGCGARDRHRATRRAALPPARRQAQCRLSCRGA